MQDIILPALSPDFTLCRNNQHPMPTALSKSFSVASLLGGLRQLKANVDQVTTRLSIVKSGHENVAASWVGWTTTNPQPRLSSPFHEGQGLSAIEMVDMSQVSESLRANMFDFKDDSKLSRCSDGTHQPQPNRKDAPHHQDTSDDQHHLQDTSDNAHQLEDTSDDAQHLRDISDNVHQLEDTSDDAQHLRDISDNAHQLEDTSDDAQHLQDTSDNAHQLEDNPDAGASVVMPQTATPFATVNSAPVGIPTYRGAIKSEARLETSTPKSQPDPNLEPEVQTEYKTKIQMQPELESKWSMIGVCASPGFGVYGNEFVDLFPPQLQVDTPTSSPRRSCNISSQTNPLLAYVDDCESSAEQQSNHHLLEYLEDSLSQVSDDPEYELLEYLEDSLSQASDDPEYEDDKHQNEHHQSHNHDGVVDFEKDVRDLRPSCNVSS
ncbi:hypothetical protein AAMO2058_001092100 [Amorphochlora amoebiformis]